MITYKFVELSDRMNVVLVQTNSMYEIVRRKQDSLTLL